MSTTTTRPAPLRSPSGLEAYPLRGYVGHRRADGSIYWTQPQELPTPAAAWVFAGAHRTAAEVRITDRTGDDLLLHVEAGRLVFPTENGLRLTGETLRHELCKQQ